LVPGATPDQDFMAGVGPVEMEWELAPEPMLVEKGHKVYATKLKCI